MNTETLIDYDIKIEISNTTKELLVTINNQSIEIALSDISITWFRRGAFQIALKFTQDQIYYDQLLSLLSKNVYAEQESLIQFLYYALSTKPTLGNYNKYILNKLETLFRACKLGIKVPPTLITRYKHDVKQWLSRGPMVTKGIQEMFSESLNNEMYYNFTTEINDKILSQISLKFNHSKVQGKIHKKFDIRSFYIDGKFYSAAIVSQIHKKTETDFRAYNLDKPPRIIIFKIPNIIEKSLSKLLKEFKL
ncbi:MAG: hypothetical protein IT239_05980, partial [Bacteroidia bacterium]|nr:hypothetical protein [Bacteroidia bacterium]